jgi:hypothetical protein
MLYYLTLRKSAAVNSSPQSLQQLHDDLHKFKTQAKDWSVGYVWLMCTAVACDVDSALNVVCRHKSPRGLTRGPAKLNVSSFL